jgi:multidrug efflux system membrane fusion protein
VIPLKWIRGRGALALLAVAGCSLACGRAAEQETTAETIAVTVQAARIGSLRDTVSAPGTVVPAAAADFVVTADQPAEIAEIPHNEGDTVKTGDVLVRLDIPSVTNEVATRQLELNEANSRLEAAKKEESNLESLVAQGLTARNKLEAARAARIAAEANATQVRTRFDSAKALESGSIIRARFPGVVIKRWHAPGETVASGESDPILRVIDPARLQVAIQVPRAQADQINQGQPATVQTGTGTEPAMVSMKGTPANEAAKTIEVRLNLASASPLPIDSAVQAEIVLTELQDVVLIPAGAVQRGDTGPFVWLATATGQATKREIRVGLTVTGSTQVLTGLAAGDQVIITGIAQLSEGAMVTISK